MVKMTEFQKKRLEYFIKAANNYEWVRLGPDDANWLSDILTQKQSSKNWEDHVNKIYEEAIKYYQTSKDEMLECSNCDKLLHGKACYTEGNEDNIYCTEKCLEDHSK